MDAKSKEKIQDLQAKHLRCHRRLSMLSASLPNGLPENLGYQALQQKARQCIMDRCRAVLDGSA